MDDTLRLEALKMALNLYGPDFEDYREILFVANQFFKFIKGETPNE
jgi:hypothetical protein